MNFTMLMNQVAQLESQLTDARGELARLPGIEFIKAVESKATLFDDKAAMLAEELTGRDEPMTKDDIRAVFVASGYEFCGRHISEACPDSTAAVEEQASYYRRNG